MNNLDAQTERLFHPVLAPTDRTTGESERRAEQSGREGTREEEGFLDKAKRKLEGR